MFDTKKCDSHLFSFVIFFLFQNKFIVYLVSFRGNKCIVYLVPFRGVIIVSVQLRKTSFPFEFAPIISKSMSFTSVRACYNHTHILATRAYPLI
jgi:hypothetical protein